MSETPQDQQQGTDKSVTTTSTPRSGRVVQSTAQRIASVISRPTKASLEKLRVNELREELKRRNLNHFGKKAELVLRLHEAIIRERAALQPPQPTVQQQQHAFPPGMIPPMPGNVPIGPPSAYYTQRMPSVPIPLQPRYHMFSQPVPMHQVPMQLTSAMPSMSHPIAVEDAPDLPRRPTSADLGGPTKVEIIAEGACPTPRSVCPVVKIDFEAPPKVEEPTAPSTALEIIVGRKGVEKHVELCEPAHLTMQPSVEILQGRLSAGKGATFSTGPEQLRELLTSGRSPLSEVPDKVVCTEKVSALDDKTTGTFGSTQTVLDNALIDKAESPISVKPYPGQTGDPSRPPECVHEEGVSPTVDTFELNLIGLTIPIRGKTQKEPPSGESPLEHQDKRKVEESGVATDLEVNALVPPHKRQHTEDALNSSREPVVDRR